ncbi:MAG: 4Fe-4S dicluster domain-containing protein [bacterium]|nr:4Fe-4S dicluster domain-containing protein [bacterium]
MEEKVISREKVVTFIDTLIGKYYVFAPVKKKDFISFDEVKSGNEVYLGYRNSKDSPKRFLFPQSEVMLRYEKGRLIEEGPFDYGKRVIFGIRPCDIKGFSLLNKVFDNHDFRDPYFITKRDSIILIGMGCREPQTTCFCTSLGIDPGSSDGADLFITDIGNKYVFQILTSKGEGIISEYDGFNDAEKADLDMKEKVSEDAKERIRTKVEISGLKEKLDGMFEDPFWSDLHEKCIGCAICTYLCPTCHCFDIEDETVNDKGVRRRNWDSCMFPLFTLHTSGHNPRESGKERMRQRIMHKFNYFVSYWGDTACVGCGRCIINCPVNMDLRKVINNINHG